MAKAKRKNTTRSVQKLTVAKSSRARRDSQEKPPTASQTKSGPGSGLWDTQKWLIGKKLAHVVKERLVAEENKGRRSGDSGGSKKLGRRPKPIKTRPTRRK